MATFLAFAGDFVAAPDKLDHYTTKIGGSAWYPGAQLPPYAQAAVACPSCSGPMSLVLQVGAAVAAVASAPPPPLARPSQAAAPRLAASSQAPASPNKQLARTPARRPTRL
jgi:hypothetical protein